MAVNIVTGMTGIEHITSHDDRARNASQFGRGKYVFDIGRKFSATAVDDNLVRIQDGMCINQGTQMGIEPNDYVDVEIDNGLLGTNRHDIIVMRYEKNEETLLEKASLAVVKGVNSSEPVDPDVTEGNILDGGDLVDDMPLYRVVIEGVNLVSVEPLFEVFDGDVGSILEELEDKVDKVAGKGLSTNDYTNEDKAKVDGIPTKTSDLQNDSNFVSDENYVHTDNNYTNADKEDVAKIDNLDTNQTQILSDVEVVKDTLGYEKKNLFDISNPYLPGTIIDTSGNLVTNLGFNTYRFSCENLNKVVFSYEKDSNFDTLRYALEKNGIVVRYTNDNSPISIDVSDSDYLYFSLATTKGTYNEQLERGSTATEYTPYVDDVDTRLTATEHSLSTTKSVNGNPISVSDSAHVNAEKLTVELELKQDLHGYDKPWIGGTGKNLLPIPDLPTTINGVRFSRNDDGSIEIERLSSSSNWATLTLATNLALSSQCIATCESGNNSTCFLEIDAVRVYQNISTSLSGTIGVAQISVAPQFSDSSVLKPMLRLATETDPTFEPYSNICPISGYDSTSVVIKDTAENPTVTDTYTLQFGDTVYGAEVDFVSGVATVKYGYADLGDLEWAVTDISGQFFAFVTTPYKAVPTSQRPNFICSEYSIGFPTYTDALPLNNGEVSSFANTANNNTIFARNTDYSNATDFKTAMNGVQLVYELATPYTIRLTPQQIKMLKGNNVLVADGDMDLEYQVDNTIGDVKEWAEEHFIPYNTYRTPPVYGFHIDGNNSDPSSRVTYIADNVNFVPAYMDYTADKFRYNSWRDIWFIKYCKPCILNQDGTVKAYLNLNDYTKDIDGNTVVIDENLTDANVMIEFPEIWHKVVPDAGDVTGASIYFSPIKVDEDYKDYAYIDKNGVHKEHFYMPAYNGSVLDGTTVMRSLSGQAVSKNLDASTEITYAKANGDGWFTEDAGEVMLINFLLILIGKSTDTQTVFGRGIDSGDETTFNAHVTGSGDLKGLFYGTNTGTGLVKVFGIENWWGLQCRRYAGDVLDNGVRKVKLCYGNEDGSTTFDFNIDGTGYVDVGVTPSGTNSGYIRTMKFTHDGMYSAISDGSSSTYYCDGQWFNNAYHTIYALRGGYSGLGVRCGAFCVALNSAPGTRGWNVCAAVSYK